MLTEATRAPHLRHRSLARMATETMNRKGEDRIIKIAAPVGTLPMEGVMRNQQLEEVEAEQRKDRERDGDGSERR